MFKTKQIWFLVQWNFQEDNGLIADPPFPYKLAKTCQTFVWGITCTGAYQAFQKWGCSGIGEEIIIPNSDDQLYELLHTSRPTKWKKCEQIDCVCVCVCVCVYDSLCVCLIHAHTHTHTHTHTHCVIKLKGASAASEG